MKKRVLFLETVAIAIMVLGMCAVGVRGKKRTDRLQDRVDTLSDHFQLLNHWLEARGEGKSTASYFQEMGYFRVGIYGMAELANRLCEDLAGSSVQVIYGIDRDVSCSTARFGEVYFPDEDFPKADVIVVTPYFSFEDIKAKLAEKVSCPIISIEDVIWSI